MSRENIIAMAKRAGAFLELSTTPEKDVAFLQRFAALVAAQEREECAGLCEQWNATHPERLAAAIRARKEET